MELPSRNKIISVALIVIGIFLIRKGFGSAQAKAIQEQSAVLPTILAFVGLAIGLGGATWYLYQVASAKNRNELNDITILNDAMSQKDNEEPESLSKPSQQDK